MTLIKPCSSSKYIDDTLDYKKKLIIIWDEKTNSIIMFVERVHSLDPNPKLITALFEYAKSIVGDLKDIDPGIRLVISDQLSEHLSLPSSQDTQLSVGKSFGSGFPFEYVDAERRGVTNGSYSCRGICV